MNKNKIYFPVSESYDEFIALTNSKDGLVIPVVSEDERRFHVTAYIKESEGNYFFDVHVKDQVTGRYHSVLRATINKSHLEDFRKKCEKMAFEIFPIVSKYFISEEDVNPRELYCIDCASSLKSLPVRFNAAKDFWKSLEETKETDVLINKNCKNTQHKTFYDPKKKVLLHKMKNACYFVQNDSDSLVNELGQVYEKYFSEEMKIFEKLIKGIMKIIERERKENAK